MEPRCLHCRTSKAAPDRKGLCQRCSLRPEVRALYVTRSKYGRRGVGSQGRRGEDRPATDSPGTLGKIRTLAARAEAGLPLFRGDDAAGWVDDGPPPEEWTVPVVGLAGAPSWWLFENDPVSGTVGRG